MGWRGRQKVCRAAFPVVLLAFACFVGFDIVFDALNVNDLQAFGFPDDDVALVAVSTLQDCARSFIGPDLASSDWYAAVPPSLLALPRTGPLGHQSQRGPLRVWRNVLLPRLNLLLERTGSSSSADPA